MRYYKYKEFQHHRFGVQESAGEYNKRRRKFLMDSEIDPRFRFDLASKLPRRSRREEAMPRHKLAAINHMLEQGFDEEQIAAVVEEPVEYIREMFEAEERIMMDGISDYRLILRNL